MTTIHEFTNPLWVQTPLGEGRARLFIDYGDDHEPILWVHLNNGKLKCIEAKDCLGCENLTFGIARERLKTSPH
jgi:hypothetical protein